MDFAVVVLIMLALSCAAFAGFGAWIAGEKGRERSTGAIIGGCFGPIGVLVLALLPARERQPPAKRPPSGMSRKSRLTAWDIPDDWEPEKPKAPKPSGDDEEDRALRFLNDN